MTDNPTTEYTRKIIVGRDKDNRPILKDKVFTRASDSYSAREAAKYVAQGMYKEYFELGNGRRGWRWSRRD
jgi:hypothetical protein